MIVCRSAAEIGKMRAANQFVADVLAELEAAVRPGVTTAELDRLAETLVRDGALLAASLGLCVLAFRPSFLGGSRTGASLAS